ncbi:MAG: hypothetical protein M1818_001574 [Claussenomyces sp. TS43310]|nr:MAG: hypothetical protein M1818_001574 [Claussenomyces sp. TS43310]
MALNYEASAGETHLQISRTLPSEVVQCLKNARFLHLATCTSDLHPHVSLMNYTYLPSTPYSRSPTIIMTTNPSSRKTHNLVSNPNVSLLVHDWVSHRPPVTSPGAAAAGAALGRDHRAGSPPAESRSSLAMLLANLNTSALSSISATINGEARLVERGTQEESFLRERHLENNTFEDAGDDNAAAAPAWGGRRGSQAFGAAGESSSGDGGRGCFIEGEEVRVVVVNIKDGRVADWKGNVRDWSLSEEVEEMASNLVNGA